MPALPTNDPFGKSDGPEPPDRRLIPVLFSLPEVGRPGQIICISNAGLTSFTYYVWEGSTGWEEIGLSAGAHNEDHDHDGTPTQKLLAVNTHETPSASTHHTKYLDAEAVLAAKTVKLDDFTAPDDNTDLNASATKHGLLPKLSNTVTEFLNGQGGWTVPGSGGGGNTLDAAYDEGGAGAGRTINVDSGLPVLLSAASSYEVLRALISGDANPRWSFGITGGAPFINFGNGTDAIDITLYRRAANVLALLAGDSFEVNTIDEINGGGAGVTIDGVLLKDGVVGTGYGGTGLTTTPKISKSYVFTYPAEDMAVADFHSETAIRAPASGKHGTIVLGTAYARNTVVGTGTNTILIRTSATLTGTRTTIGTINLGTAREADSGDMASTLTNGLYLWVACSAVGGTAPKKVIVQIDASEETY